MKKDRSKEEEKKAENRKKEQMSLFETIQRAPLWRTITNGLSWHGPLEVLCLIALSRYMPSPFVSFCFFVFLCSKKKSIMSLNDTMAVVLNDKILLHSKVDVMIA